MLAKNFTFTEDSIECLNVTIIDDSVIEGYESFSIRLFYVTTNVGVTLGQNSTAIITIRDNEGMLLCCFFCNC